MAKDFENWGFKLFQPGSEMGSWQVRKIPGAGRITPATGGFLIANSGTTHAIQADFTRTRKTTGTLTFLDGGSGLPRWTAQWEDRSVESPVQLGDRVYVYTREFKVGTFCLGLDPSGKVVQRFALPFDWNVSAGTIAHGRELFFHGLSSSGGFVVAYDPATGQETWRENVGFGSPVTEVSGSMAVLHSPYNQGAFAVVDLASHRVLKKGTIQGLVERGMAVVGEAAYFWGKKVDGRVGYLQCLDLKTLKVRWERTFDVETGVTAGLLHQGGRLWALVQGPQGATRMHSLDPASGATLREVPLEARLDLEANTRTVAFQNLMLVDTKGGRVLGFPLPL
ncbi:MAG TPA: PQQ-binding-like beta-propeller repeat protein [Holophagaceae bacterium]|nr:PQQ-binding-like beta-propeller repeat protein [Holophagaceae bacterium]